jgi:hypothetical protein
LGRDGSFILVQTPARNQTIYRRSKSTNRGGLRFRKRQRIAIAEDNYIRTLENAESAFRDVIITLGLFGAILAVANISLALQKQKREESSEK